MAVLLGTFLLLVLTVAAVGVLYAISLRTAVAAEPLRAAPFSGGSVPAEHSLSRFHARFYPAALLFLAFDVEMLFMYPWTLVVAQFGRAAVIEMFGFLALLVAGIGYAWREGAFRWT